MGPRENPPGYEDDPDEERDEPIEDDRDAEDIDPGDGVLSHNYYNFPSN